MTLSEWFEELQDLIRRRLMLILRMTVLGCILSFFFALSQKHAYTSTSVLHVEGAKVAGELATPTVNGANARQLQMVEQQIMSHSAILEVGHRLGLLDDIAGLPEGQKVGLLRQSVSVSGVAAANEGRGDDGAISLVRISATWGDRQSAQLLAREITERTIELSRDIRQERARETLSFFSLRERKLEGEVAELEKRLAVFREENGMSEAGLRDVQQREIEALKAEILSVERQMITLERQLAQTAGDDTLSRVERQERTENVERLNALDEQHDYLTRNLETLSQAQELDPAIRVQLVQYQRQLTALQEDLENVSASRKSAEVGFQLESQGQSEHLAVLEPASWPDYPSTRSRTKLAVLGAVASVLVALCLAVLMDMRNPVLRSAALMERDLGYAPIVTVPGARPRKKRFSLSRVFRRRRKQRAF